MKAQIKRPTAQAKSDVTPTPKTKSEHVGAIEQLQSAKISSLRSMINTSPQQLKQDRLQRRINSSAVVQRAKPVQRVTTLFTDALKNASPSYLRELADQHAPGLWDITNAGAFAVTHKGRKDAMGMSDANYSAAILKTTARTGWFGLDTKHFNQYIDLSSPKLAAAMYGRDCADAAEYLMHYHQGQDLTTTLPGSGAALHPTRSQAEKSTNASSDYVAVTQRPAILPTALPAGVKDANAQAGIGEAYCIVSEPNSGKYNFHYGCVAAQKGNETLTVEGFATSSALTTPDWSFNVYDSASTFHGVWQAGMTKSTPPFAPGYPFTFVTKLV